MESVINLKPTVGETRLCLDPWSKMFVRVGGQVCLCCYAPPVGSISADPLDKIVNGPEAEAYRNGLLTGNLLPHCINCPEKRTVPLTEEVKLVTDYLEHGVFQAL